MALYTYDLAYCLGYMIPRAFDNDKKNININDKLHIKLGI